MLVLDYRDSNGAAWLNDSDDDDDEQSPSPTVYNDVRMKNNGHTFDKNPPRRNPDTKNTNGVATILDKNKKPEVGVRSHDMDLGRLQTTPEAATPIGTEPPPSKGNTRIGKMSVSPAASVDGQGPLSGACPGRGVCETGARVESEPPVPEEPGNQEPTKPPYHAGERTAIELTSLACFSDLQGYVLSLVERRDSAVILANTLSSGMEKNKQSEFRRRTVRDIALMYDGYMAAITSSLVTLKNTRQYGAMLVDIPYAAYALVHGGGGASLVTEHPAPTSRWNPGAFWVCFGYLSIGVVLCTISIFFHVQVSPTTVTEVTPHITEWMGACMDAGSM